MLVSIAVRDLSWEVNSQRRVVKDWKNITDFTRLVSTTRAGYSQSLVDVEDFIKISTRVLQLYPINAVADGQLLTLNMFHTFFQYFFFSEQVIVGSVSSELKGKHLVLTRLGWSLSFHIEEICLAKLNLDLSQIRSQQTIVIQYINSIFVWRELNCAGELSVEWNVSTSWEYYFINNP